MFGWLLWVFMYVNKKPAIFHGSYGNIFNQLCGWFLTGFFASRARGSHFRMSICQDSFFLNIILEIPNPWNYWKAEIAKKYSQKESAGSINGDLRSAKYKGNNCDIFFMPLRIIGPSRVLNLYVYDASGCFFFFLKMMPVLRCQDTWGWHPSFFIRPGFFGWNRKPPPPMLKFVSLYRIREPPGSPETLSRWKVCLWARFTVSEECQMPRKLFFIALPCVLPKKTTVMHA